MVAVFRMIRKRKKEGDVGGGDDGVWLYDSLLNVT